MWARYVNIYIYVFKPVYIDIYGVHIHIYLNMYISEGGDQGWLADVARSMQFSSAAERFPAGRSVLAESAHHNLAEKKTTQAKPCCTTRKKGGWPAMF